MIVDGTVIDYYGNYHSGDNNASNVTRSHLGMYVSGGPAGEIDGAVGGGGSITRGSYGITDTAGVIPAGTTASVKESSGGGGIAGVYNASRFLPSNQGLVFTGFFDYGSSNVSVGTISGLVAAAAGSGQTNTYTFGGSVFYNVGKTYLQAIGAYNVGNGTEAFAGDGSTGSYNTRGYTADLRLGHVFVLANTISSASPGIITKAPPKPVGGYMVGLDVSGHVGYDNQQMLGYTDSTGFVFGTDTTQYGELGGRAKLFALVPRNGFDWTPFVAVTVDQRFGFSSNLIIPNQALLAGGDLVGLQAAQTFWGTQLGLDVRGPNGWTVGVKGFYSASADTNIIGGNAYVKIPLTYGPTSALAARY